MRGHNQSVSTRTCNDQGQRVRAPSKVTVISERSANFEPCVITTKMHRGSKFQNRFGTALDLIDARTRRVLRLVACNVVIMLTV